LGNDGAPPLAVKALLTPRNMLLPRVVLPNLVVGQTVRALLWRSAWKFNPLRPAIQSHLRSLEPTQIDPPPGFQGIFEVEYLKNGAY